MQPPPRKVIIIIIIIIIIPPTRIPFGSRRKRFVGRVRTASTKYSFSVRQRRIDNATAVAGDVIVATKIRWRVPFDPTDSPVNKRRPPNDSPGLESIVLSKLSGHVPCSFVRCRLYDRPHAIRRFGNLCLAVVFLSRFRSFPVAYVRATNNDYTHLGAQPSTKIFTRTFAFRTRHGRSLYLHKTPNFFPKSSRPGHQSGD